MPKSKHPTHTCPCGCGTQVLYTRYSCAPSWRRLPDHLKAAIMATYRRDPSGHAEAMLAAKNWLDAHPPAEAVTAR